MRVLELRRTDHGAVDIHRFRPNIVEIPDRPHDIHIHRKVGRNHLAFDSTLQFLRLQRYGMKKESVTVPVERLEKWNTLDMVPVEMGEKNITDKRI